MLDELGTLSDALDYSATARFSDNSHFEGLRLDSDAEDGMFSRQDSDQRSSQSGLAVSENSSADDMLGFFQSNLAPHKLLTQQEEQALGHKMVEVCHGIIEVVMSRSSSAADFVSILHSIINHPLKVSMFVHSKAYFCLRQEFQEIVKEEKNGHQISRFLAEAKCCIGSGEAQHKVPVSPKLKQLIQQINWPYPLLVMISNRYCHGDTAGSLLQSAFYDFLKSVKFTPQRLAKKVLDKPQSKELCQLKRDYISVRDTFVVRNLPLVFNIAQRYAVVRADLMELIQEGSMGLIRAAEKYRVKTGNRFSTYAYAWIESKVRSAKVNLNNLIPISPEINRELAKLHGLIEETKRAGNNDSIDIIAKKLQLKKGRVNFLMTLNRHFLSLDYHYAGDDERDLHSFYADESSILSDQCESSDIKEKLLSSMHHLLNEREAYIVCERFGLMDSVPKTIQVVADIVGISRERVRQIEAGALIKLHTFMSSSKEGEEFYQYLADG